MPVAPKTRTLIRFSLFLRCSGFLFADASSAVNLLQMLAMKTCTQPGAARVRSASRFPARFPIAKELPD
jgi:hypothetical protein